MFGFIKNWFLTALTSLSSVNPLTASLKCISMNNQECKVRPQILNINNDEPAFFSI